MPVIAASVRTDDADAMPLQRVSRPSPCGPAFRSPEFLNCHVESHGPKSRPLLSQLLGTQGWYVLLDEWCGRAANPYGWYRVACNSCRMELPSDLAPPGGIAGSSAEGPPGTRAGENDGAAPATGRGAADTSAVIQHAGFDGGAGGPVAADGRSEVAVIGLPGNVDDGGPCEDAEHAAPTSLLSPGRRVFYCRPCPLLQRRRAPVYRTFPALHVSDEPYIAAAAAAAASLRSSLGAPSAVLAPSPASAPMWQAWQAHVMAPPGARAARELSSGGAGAGGGAADVARRSSMGGGSAGGAEADGTGMGGDAGGGRGFVRQWPSGPRLSRSLSSDNLSGELKLSQATAGVSISGDSGKPQPRQRSSTDGTANSSSYGPSKPPTLSQAAAAATPQQQPGTGATGSGPGLPRPITHKVLNASAAGDAASLAAAGVAPTSAAAASPFATALGASLSLRNVLRGASVAGAMAAGPAAGGAGGGSSAAAGAAASAASSVGSVLPPAAAAVNSRSLASYKAEQELVRQQLAALTQVLAWGGDGASAIASAASAAPAPGAARLPSRAEMGRLRQLMCVQTAGSGAFLVGRLRDEVFGTAGTVGTGAVASSPGGAGGAGAVPLQAGVRTPVGGPGAATATADAAAGAGSVGGGAGGRCVHWAAFEVLAEALDAVASAAVAAGEFGVLGAALEVAMATYTYTGKGKVLLLHRLTSNPYLYTRAAWSGIFCHTLLAAAMAAATCGHSGGSNGEIPHARSAADAPAAGGHAALPLPQPEYLRRQRILLQQALQRSLAAQACWMMHLGVCEESAWELVTGLVAAARVADLPVEGGQLHRLLLNVRAAMRAARAAASHQHRRRMPDPGCSAVPYLAPATTAQGLSALSRAGAAVTAGTTNAGSGSAAAAGSRMTGPSSPRWPPARGGAGSSMMGAGSGPRSAPLPPPVTPHLSFKDSGQSSGSQDDTATAAAAAQATAKPGRAANASWAAAADSGSNTATAADAAAVSTPGPGYGSGVAGALPGTLRGRIQGAGNSPNSTPLKSTPPDAAGSAGGAAGKALAARALAAAAAVAASGAVHSPRSTAVGSVRSMATGGGPSREKPYRVQYERLLAIASSGGRLAAGSGTRSPGGSAGEAQPSSPDRRLSRSSVSVKGGKPGKEPVQSAALSLGGRGRAPITCLAAASGVVLAAPRLPHYHLLALQAEGELRATARLTLAHLDGAYVDAAVLAADGAVAAISVAPLPPRRHRPALIPGAAAQAAAAAQQQQQQPRFPRVVALVDVAAERTVRELRPASAGRTTALQMSPTANLLATGCAASWARLWDIRASAGAGSSTTTTTAATTSAGGGGGGAAAAAHARVLSSAAVSLATGQGGVCALLADTGRLRLYTGGRDGSALEWDLRKPNAPLVVYRGHAGWVTSLALLPASALTPAATAALLLVTAGTDWTVRVWNPRDATPVAVAAAPAAVAAAAAAATAASAPASTAPRGPGGSGGGGAGRGRGTGRPSSGGSSDRPSSGGGGTGRNRSSIAGARGAAVAAGDVPLAAAGNVAAPDWAAAAVPVAVCWSAAVLVGHGGPVSALHVDQAAGLIYSGSRDGMLAAWAPDGSCAGMRRHHGGAVRLIAPYAAAAAGSAASSTRRQGWPLVTCAGDGSAALWGGAASDGAEAQAATALGAAVHVPDVLGDGLAAVRGGGVLGGVWCGEQAGPLAAFHAASLTRAAAWDAVRGVMVVGDDRGVVRAWAPPLP